MLIAELHPKSFVSNFWGAVQNAVILMDKCGGY